MSRAMVLPVGAPYDAVEYRRIGLGKIQLEGSGSRVERTKILVFTIVGVAAAFAGFGSVFRGIFWVWAGRIILFTE
jgi:hypothetical protein